MIELRGKTQYSAAWSHALKNDQGFHTQHSLVASLHPNLSNNIESAWRQALEQPHDLQMVEVDGPVYIAENEGSGTWGHWLVHNLPRVVMFFRTIPNGRIVVPEDYKTGRYETCLQLLDKFGIGLDRLIFLKRTECLSANSVWLIDLPFSNGVTHPMVFDLYSELRESIKSPNNADESEAVFLRRSADSRKISNWNRVRPVVEEVGFRISSDVGTLEDQISLWQNAEMVSGVLGSDLTNMLLGNVKQLFVITPQWFGDNFFYGLAAALGIEWNELVCPNGSLTELRDPKHRSSFNVGPHALRRLYQDRMQA